MSFQPLLRLSRRPKTILAVTSVAAGGLLFHQASNLRVRDELEPVVLERDKTGRVIPPKFPRIKTRSEQLRELQNHRSEKSAYDLVVIGGGATGTGIALDAATRGLKVALVERGDFASGTSSKSTKLVHGGVRYLEKAFWELDWGQMQLVREALAERKTFLHIAPHLSQALPILLPLYKWWQAAYFRAGTVAYDLLAGGEALKSSYLMSRTRVLEEFPLVKKEGLFGGLVYYDGQHNDSRMNISIATTAALYGATVANHVEATSLEKDAAGKITGVKVKDRLSDGGEITVRAKGVINATGPFVDSVRTMDEPAGKQIVASSSGVHVVLPRHFSPKSMGALDAATSDGRLLFILPWEGKTLAGTTDNACPVDANPLAHEEDIDFVLTEVRKLLAPNVELSRDDVLSAWSGIRPLVRDPNAKNTESLVRSHLVTVSDSGLLTCAGGKWTTYRHMAEEAVDKAIKMFNLQPGPLPSAQVGGLQAATDLDTSWTAGKCQTKNVKLVGAHGWNVEGGLDTALMGNYGISPDVAEHLASSYGDRAWEIAEEAQHDGFEQLCSAVPLLKAEVKYVIRNEYAQTAADVLARRTRLAFLDVREAFAVLPKVVEVLAKELGWSDARRRQEHADGMRFLESMGLPSDLQSARKGQVVTGEFDVGRDNARRIPLQFSPGRDGVEEMAS